jgi:TrmH family RNA methyltransferase
MYKSIASLTNPLLTKISKLNKSSNYRHQCAQALICGEHLILEAVRFQRLNTLVLLESSITKYPQLLHTLPKQIQIYLVSSQIMHKINPLDTPCDILGLVDILEPKFDKNIYTQDILILDAIQDPGNLGTILRLAVSCGVRHIILTKGCVDCYNLKVLRASQGIQFGLNLYTNIDAIEFLTNYQGLVLITSLMAQKSIYELDMRRKNVAWIFGNEGSGVSSQLLEMTKDLVKIPMLGDVESLNVAMASTVCLFEMLRQRNYEVERDE